jgi:3-hydroxy-9,10-secoandrosta-1,3,5(10)-triene-9,17-dione monooxygenase
MTAVTTASTREELLDRARELIPQLRERAAEVDATRHVPVESVRAIIDAGLLRITVPERFGGLAGPELELDVALEVAETLARGCGSTGWCYTVWVAHNMVVASSSLPLQAEFWADGPDVLSTTMSSPRYVDTSFTDEGFTVSGHWRFASGSDHADWFLLQSPELLGGWWVRRADVEIVDTWRTLGMRGTASNDIVVKDLEIPAYRFWSFLDATVPEGPLGWREHGMASLRLQSLQLGWTILSATVGAAQGAVDAAAQLFASPKAIAGPPPSMTAGPPSQGPSPAQKMRLAEASAEVDMASLVWRTDIREMLDHARAGTPIPRLRRAQVRRNQVYAARLVQQAVTRLYEATGGSGIADTNPVQRGFRDVHTGSHHQALPWDTTAEAFGHVLMGLPDFGPDFIRDGIDRPLLGD